MEAPGRAQTSGTAIEVMQFIETERDLAGAIEAVTGQALLAVDTEAAGYHRYRDAVCVVQMSTRTETWVIDALAVDITPLGRVLADDRTEVLLHDADFDLRLLGRDYGIRVARLFDTKVAAQFLGETSIGLASLAERLLGVQLDKKYQRTDWARRPLSAEQLAYAAEDTRHLPALRDKLAAGLESAGRMAWATEEFQLRTNGTSAPAEAVEAFWKLRNIRDLRGRQLAVLRDLYGWRDRLAQARDVAAFRVVGNDVLVAVARACPKDAATLAEVAGLPASVRERYGAELLAVARAAAASAPETWPERRRQTRRPPPDPAFDKRVDRLKAVRDEVADALGIDRGFLMPRQQLEDIARLQPSDTEALGAVPDIRRWQIEALGRRVIEASSTNGSDRGRPGR